MYRLVGVLLFHGELSTDRQQSSLYGWMDGFLSAFLPVVSNLVLLMKGSIHSIEMLILIPVIIIIWMDLFVNNISGVSLSL